MSQAPDLDLSWITDDLAVGGHIPAEAFGRLAGEAGVGAVVDLRAEARDDARLVGACGMLWLHLPTPDLCAVSPAALNEGVAFARAARAAGRRLLVHCQYGIGRSATLALCVLVDRGRDPLDALVRLKAGRAAVSPNPEQYHAWRGWLETRSAPCPGFDAFARIAYATLRDRRG